MGKSWLQWLFLALHQKAWFCNLCIIRLCLNPFPNSSEHYPGLICNGIICFIAVFFFKDHKVVEITEMLRFFLHVLCIYVHSICMHVYIYVCLYLSMYPYIYEYHCFIMGMHWLVVVLLLHIYISCLTSL